MRIRINVSGARPEHTINGLEFDLDGGVNGLRSLVAERIGAAPEQLRLIYMGRLIDDSRPLDSFLRDGTTIHVVVTRGVPGQQSEPPESGNSNSNNNNNGDSTFPPVELLNFMSDFAGGATATVGLIQGSAPSLFDSVRSLLPSIFDDGEGAAVRIFAQGTSESSRPPRSSAQEQRNQREREREQQNQQQQQQQQQQRTHQTIHRFSFLPAVSPPEVAAPAPLHIHVHVTPNELEDLPGRLQRFLRRANSSGINLQAHVEQGLVPRDSSSFARAAVAATNSAGSNNSAVTTASANVVERATPFEVVNADTDGNDVGGIRDIISTMFRNIPASALFQVIRNDYSFAAGLRQSLFELLSRCLEPTESTASLTREERIQLFSQRAANAAVNGMMQSSELLRFIEQEMEPRVNFFEDMRKYIAFMHEEFVVGVLNRDLSDDEWARSLKIFVTRAAGIFMGHFSNFFRQRSSGISGIAAMFAQNILSNIGGINSTFLQNNLYFVASGVQAMLGSLYAEYQNSYQREGDAAIFAAPPTSGEQRREHENVELQEEVDDFLDSCLDELCAETRNVATTAGSQGHMDTKNNNNSSSNSESAAAINLLDSHIRDFCGLTDELREDIQRRAQRFRNEEPDNSNNNNDDDNNGHDNVDDNSASVMWQCLKRRKR